MGWTQRVKRAFFVKGGVHPPARKQTTSMKVVPGPSPEFVVIPMRQHVGAPCEPNVEVGDKVLMGQKIGDSPEYISAPVHSSVSGVVEAISLFPHPSGREQAAVKIVSDGQSTTVDNIDPVADPMALSPDEVRRRVREAGIVGLGGAAFPTHVKLAPPADKPIDTVILNGSECEPYLSGDFRTMVERPEAVIKGGLIIGKTVGAGRVLVGIEHNRTEAIEAMRQAGEPFGVDVVVLPCRYPTGAEKTLIKNVTGKQVPSGGLPMDVGIIVNNVGTCAAIYDCLSTGLPLIDRVLTIAGDGVAGRANLRVKIGTPVADVINFVGGYAGEPGKVLIGGPMMGLAQHTTEIPVIKSTTGIVVLRGETLFTAEPEHFVCIRCGKCVRRCPMNLMPYLMGSYADAGMWERLEPLNIEDCVECGSCAYVCPTKNSLVQLIKVGKGGLDRRTAKMEALEARHAEEANDSADDKEEEENANA
ncbi:MAG: electron transport complex subunit RsxC [Candidatus Geothermincolia bacterium]